MRSVFVPMLPRRFIAIAALLFCVAASVRAQDMILPPPVPGSSSNSGVQSSISTLPPDSPLIPNPNLTYHDPSIKSFGGSKAVTESGNREFKPFAFLRAFSFRSKQYETNKYNASQYWAGQVKFKTSDADVSTRGPLAGLIRLFKTKTADTKVAAASTKVYNADRKVLQVEEEKNAVFRGKIEGKIKKEGAAAFIGSDPIHNDDGATPSSGKAGSNPHALDYTGSLHTMSVDDVRALLGKDK
ncbi:MAG TPA: hypothetical protein VG733_17940 [Chthoniobacteraceae bacterium]|nr:hypothetical protein [Chthoniobacteraceae bacterium]